MQPQVIVIHLDPLFCRIWTVLHEFCSHCFAKRHLVFALAIADPTLALFFLFFRSLPPHRMIGADRFCILGGASDMVKVTS